MSFEDNVEKLLRKMEEAESKTQDMTEVKVNIGKLQTNINNNKDDIKEVKNSITEIHKRINDCQRDNKGIGGKKNGNGGWRAELLKKEWDIVKIFATMVCTLGVYLFMYYWPYIDKFFRGAK